MTSTKIVLAAVVLSFSTSSAFADFKVFEFIAGEKGTLKSTVTDSIRDQGTLQPYGDGKTQTVSLDLDDVVKGIDNIK